MFRYEPDPGVGEWLRPRLGPFGPAVGSLVPRGYAAYARILHPMYDEAHAPVTWAAVAAETGRVVHPTAQAWRVAGRPEVYAPRLQPLGQPVTPRPGSGSGDDSAEGSMDGRELRLVADVLGRHTAEDADRGLLGGPSWTAA